MLFSPSKSPWRLAYFSARGDLLLPFNNPETFFVSPDLSALDGIGLHPYKSSGDTDPTWLSSFGNREILFSS